MKRGEVYLARLEPVEGSEQGGTRPIVVVSRDAINLYSPVVLAVPCTTYKQGKRIFPTQVLIEKLNGGLSQDSIAMADQIRVLAKPRLIKLLGTLSENKIVEVNCCLLNHRLQKQLPIQKTAFCSKLQLVLHSGDRLNPSSRR